MHEIHIEFSLLLNHKGTLLLWLKMLMLKVFNFSTRADRLMLVVRNDGMLHNL